MAGNTVRFVIEADAKSASTVLKSLADDSSTTSKRLKEDSEENSSSFARMGASAGRLRESMVGLIGMVGLGGLAFGLKDAVQGGEELQASQTQLQQALKQTGQIAGGAYGRLKDFAESLSTKGGFSTQQNVSALTALVRETHSATESQKLLNLETNIARGRGMALSSAQTIVQRAYTGTIGRLQQLLGPMVAAKEASFGLTQAHAQEAVQLEAQSKLYGKLGPQWLAQQKVYADLTPQARALATLQDKSATAQQIIGAAEKVFGGATGAYASTTQGKVSDLQNSLQNLKDTIGEKLLPVVNYLAKDALFVVNAFGKLPVPVDAALVGFTALGLILKPIKTSFDMLYGAAKMAGKWLGIVGDDSEATAAKVSLMGDAAERSAGEETVGGAEAGAGGGAAGLAGRGGLAAGALGVLGPAALIGGGAYLLAKSGAGGPLPNGERPVGSVPLGENAVGRAAGLGGGFALPASAPQVIELHHTTRLDSRVLTESVTRYALNRAARGPTSLVGGSLVTGNTSQLP